MPVKKHHDYRADWWICDTAYGAPCVYSDNGAHKLKWDRYGLKRCIAHGHILDPMTGFNGMTREQVKQEMKKP